jgi:hypothetical protein
MIDFETYARIIEYFTLRKPEQMRNVNFWFKSLRVIENFIYLRDERIATHFLHLVLLSVLYNLGLLLQKRVHTAYGILIYVYARQDCVTCRSRC